MWNVLRKYFKLLKLTKNAIETIKCPYDTSMRWDIAKSSHTLTVLQYY